MISMALREARGSIPSRLGHAPRPVGAHHNGYKASEWKMWLLFFGPALLQNCLKPQFRDNFLVLADIYATATRPFNADAASVIPRLHTLCEQFVRSYQQLYFDNKDRMPACTVNVHSILHLAEDVEHLGPACYFWQFPIERYCGIIKPMAKSKSLLDTSLANSLVERERLNVAQWKQPETAEAPDHLCPVLLNHFPNYSIPPATLRGLLYEISETTRNTWRTLQIRDP